MLRSVVKITVNTKQALMNRCIIRSLNIWFDNDLIFFFINDALLILGVANRFDYLTGFIISFNNTLKTIVTGETIKHAHAIGKVEYVTF